MELPNPFFTILETKEGTARFAGSVTLLHSAYGAASEKLKKHWQSPTPLAHLILKSSKSTVPKSREQGL